jgi:hypothetical protein
MTNDMSLAVKDQVLVINTKTLVLLGDASLHHSANIETTGGSSFKIKKAGTYHFEAIVNVKLIPEALINAGVVPAPCVLSLQFTKKGAGVPFVFGANVGHSAYTSINLNLTQQCVLSTIVSVNANDEFNLVCNPRGSEMILTHMAGGVLDDTPAVCIYVQEI